MTAIRKTPELRVIAYPKTAIRRALQEGISLSDSFGDSLSNVGGDAFDQASVAGVGTGDVVGAQWKGQPAFTQLDSSLQYARFPDEGAGLVTFGLDAIGSGGHGGFFLKRNAEWWNNRLVASAPGDPEPGAINGTPLPAAIWNVKSGTGWETRVPHIAHPPRTFLYNAVETPNSVAEIESDFALAKQQEFEIEIQFIGVADAHWSAQSSSSNPVPAGARYLFGDKKLSIHFVQGQAATFEILEDAPVTVPPTVPAPAPSWTILRTFSESGTFDFTEFVQLSVWRLNNYVMVTLNKKTYAVRLTKPGTKPAKPPTDIPDNYTGSSIPREPIDGDIPSGKHGWRMFGCSAAMGFAKLWCGAIRSGGLPPTTPASGTLKRTIPHVAKRTGTDTIAIYPAGNVQPNHVVTGSAEADSQRVSYVLTLQAGSDCHDSPFVASVTGYWPATWSEPTGGSLDITRCVTGNVHYTTGSPGVQMSMTAQVPVSRILLDALAQENSVTWQTYAGQYCPIDIATRWRCEDDVSGAVTYTPWQYVFDGYIMNDTKGSAYVNDAAMTLDCRDMITARLTHPAAIIDARTPAMDCLWMRGANEVPPVLKFYGADGVYWLLRHFLSEHEADLLNGVGPTGLDFFPPNWYPLLSKDHDKGGYFPLLNGNNSTTGFNIKAPWGQDARQYILTLATPDSAVFFMGYNPAQPNANDGKPYPIYGRLRSYLQAWNAIPPVLLPDTIYTAAGDANIVIDSIQVSHIPNKGYNAFQVWSSIGENDMFPSAFRGYDRLPPTDPLAQEKSWERTLLIRSLRIFNITPERVKELATLLQQELVGVDPMVVTVKLAKGDGAWRFGHCIKPKLENNTPNAVGDLSDVSSGLNGKVLRVVQVDGDIDITKMTYTTTLTCRPPTAKEMPTGPSADGTPGAGPFVPPWYTP